MASAFLLTSGYPESPSISNLPSKELLLSTLSPQQKTSIFQGQPIKAQG